MVIVWRVMGIRELGCMADKREVREKREAHLTGCGQKIKLGCHFIIKSWIR